MYQLGERSIKSYGRNFFLGLLELSRLLKEQIYISFNRKTLPLVYRVYSNLRIEIRICCAMNLMIL